MKVYVVKSIDGVHEGEYTHPYFFSTHEKAAEYLEANEGWYEGEDDAIWIEEHTLDDWQDRVKDLENDDDWF